MLTALDRQVELAVHIKGALNNGCTVDEIRETLLRTAVYCGVPAAIEAFPPAEIEHVIAGHPGVAQVAVCVVPDPVWGEVPAAFVVGRPGQAPRPDEVRDWVRDRLRSTRVPAYVEFVPELPLQRARQAAPPPPAGRLRGPRRYPRNGGASAGQTVPAGGSAPVAR
jgi:hypothetical protein